jgi:hypothetical protein
MYRTKLHARKNLSAELTCRKSSVSTGSTPSWAAEQHAAKTVSANRSTSPNFACCIMWIGLACCSKCVQLMLC